MNLVRVASGAVLGPICVFYSMYLRRITVLALGKDALFYMDAKKTIPYTKIRSVQWMDEKRLIIMVEGVKISLPIRLIEPTKREEFVQLLKANISMKGS